METYVSTDIETDGPIPAKHSMLSVGSVAYNSDGEIIGKFAANLKTLPDATEDEKTMEWWKTQPKAWKLHRVNLQEPQEAMHEYLKWIKSLPGTPVFVAYPANFDWMFVQWYLVNFTGEMPFGYAALDIKSLVMGVLKATEFNSVTTENMPQEWTTYKNPLEHVALADALEQGILLFKVLKGMENG